MSGSSGWNSSALLSKSLPFCGFRGGLEQSHLVRISCPRWIRDSIISPFCNNMRNRPADLSLASFGVVPGARLARGLLFSLAIIARLPQTPRGRQVC